MDEETLGGSPPIRSIAYCLKLAAQTVIFVSTRASLCVVKGDLTQIMACGNSSGM